jgi:hypothetical protein
MIKPCLGNGVTVALRTLTSRLLSLRLLANPLFSRLKQLSATSQKACTRVHKTPQTGVSDTRTFGRTEQVLQTAGMPNTAHCLCRNCTPFAPSPAEGDPLDVDAHRRTAPTHRIRGRAAVHGASRLDGARQPGRLRPGGVKTPRWSETRPILPEPARYTLHR